MHDLILFSAHPVRHILPPVPGGLLIPDPAPQLSRVTPNNRSDPAPSANTYGEAEEPRRPRPRCPQLRQRPQPDRRPGNHRIQQDLARRNAFRVSACYSRPDNLYMLHHPSVDRYRAVLHARPLRQRGQCQGHIQIPPHERVCAFDPSIRHRGSRHADGLQQGRVAYPALGGARGSRLDTCGGVAEDQEAEAWVPLEKGAQQRAGQCAEFNSSQVAWKGQIDNTVRKVLRSSVRGIISYLCCLLP